MELLHELGPGKWTLLQQKVKVEREICIAPHCKKLTSKALRHGSHSFTLQSHHACLYLVSVHQTAPPLIVIAAI